MWMSLTQNYIFVIIIIIIIIIIITIFYFIFFGGGGGGDRYNGQWSTSKEITWFRGKSSMFLIGYSKAWCLTEVY